VTAIGDDPVASQIAALRAIGGDVRISFGGEDGSELAQTCTSLSQLEAAYQDVISGYDVNKIDFDIDIQWDFCEFTYNAAELFANISSVDFACIPIGLALTDTSGSTQSVAGLPAGGLDAVCAGLTAQAAADGNPGPT
jgi:Beta-1,3-glucanase